MTDNAVRNYPSTCVRTILTRTARPRATLKDLGKRLHLASEPRRHDILSLAVRIDVAPGQFELKCDSLDRVKMLDIKIGALDADVLQIEASFPV